MKKWTITGIFIIAIAFVIFRYVQTEEASAEQFTLPTVTSEEVTVKEKGSYILNFWATYCPPCKREMPTFEANYKALQKQQVSLITVNVGEPTRIVTNYAQKHKLTLPMLLDRDEDIHKRYDVLSLPSTFFIKDGEVVKAVTGEITEQQLLEYTKLIQ